MSDPVGLYKQKYLGPGVATVPIEQPDPVAAYKASYLPKGALPDTLKLISPQPSDVTATPVDKSQVSVPTPQPRLEDLLASPDLSPEQRDRITRLIHVQRGQAGAEVETPDSYLSQARSAVSTGATEAGLLPFRLAEKIAPSVFGPVVRKGEEYVAGIQPTLDSNKSPTLQALVGTAGELAGGFLPSVLEFGAAQKGADLLAALARTASPKTAEAATAALSRAASRTLEATGSEYLARAVLNAPRDLTATGLFMAATDPQALKTKEGIGMTLLLTAGASLVHGKYVTDALAKTIDARRAQAFMVKALDQPTTEVDPVIAQKAAAAQAKQAEMEGRRAARTAWTGATPEMRATLVPEFGADVHATEWKSLTKEQKATVAGKIQASLGKMAEVVENQAPTTEAPSTHPSIIQRVQDAINGAIEQPERRAPERLTDEEYFRITGETREQQAARQAADVTTRMPVDVAKRFAELVTTDVSSEARAKEALNLYDQLVSQGRNPIQEVLAEIKRRNLPDVGGEVYVRDNLNTILTEFGRKPLPEHPDVLAHQTEPSVVGEIRPAAEPPKVEAPAETAKPPEEKGHPALSEPLGKTLDELDDQIDTIDELYDKKKINDDEFNTRLEQITAAKEAIKTQAKAKNVVTVTRRALERSALQQLDDTTLRTMQAKLIGERNTAESEITRQSVLHDLNAVQRELRWRKDVKDLTPQSLDTHANELKADWLEAKDEATKQQIADRAGQVEREIMRRARPSPIDIIKNEKGAISFDRDPLGADVPDTAPDYVKRVLDHVVVGNFDSVFPSVTDSWFNKGEKVYANTVRGTYAFDKFDKRFGLTGAPATESAGSYAELLQGSAGRAQNALENGTFILWDALGTPIKKLAFGLKELLEPLKGRLWEFRAYDVARTAIERAASGKATGISLNDAVRTVTNAAPDVKLAGERVVELRRALLAYYTDSGMFNGELMNKIVQLMDYYAPFDRILTGKTGQSRIERVGAKVRKLGQAVGAGQQVEEFKGSKAPIVDTIQATVDQFRRFFASADKNRLAKILVEAAESNPVQARGLIWRDLKATPGEIDPTIKAQAENLRKWSTDQGIEMTSEQSEMIAQGISDRRLRTRSDKLYLWRDGKREVWNIAPELAQAYSSLSPQELGMFTRIAGFPPSTAKQLITDNPAFAFFNAVRDTYDAAIQSKYGFRVGVDSFKGFLEAVRDGQFRREFRASAGTAGGIGSRALQSTERATREVLGETKTFRHPLDALRAFALPFEEAARLGEFIRAREAGAPVADAAIAAQRVTTNFRQMGLSMRALSHMTMFLNPAIQSLDTNIRAALRQPGRVLAVGVGAITLPAILLWAANHGDKEITELRKSRFGSQFFYFRIPDMVPIVGGQIAKLPKAFVFGQVFGTSIENALDKAFDDDPTAGGRFIDALWTQVGFNVIPNTLDYTLGLIANKDFSTGADIAPRSEGNEQVSPRYQFNPTTGATARTLGDMFNISPAKIEFAVRNALGTLGQDALRGIDMVTDARAKYPTPVAADLPIVGRLLARYPTQGSFSIQRFYTDAEKSERASNDLKLLEASGKIDKAKALASDKGFEIGSAEVYAEARKALADLRGTASFVIELPANAMTPDRKREIVNNILSQMTDYARRVNEGVEAARMAYKASRK